MEKRQILPKKATVSAKIRLFSLTNKMVSDRIKIEFKFCDKLGNR